MKVSLKKGVTLTEVIIGAIILSITFGGLLATFIAVRKYVKRANKRLIANDLASQKLNDLYRSVKADEWDVADPGGPYSLQPAASGGISSYTIDNQSYSGNSYLVEDLAPKEYRRVSVTVNYP